MSEEGFFGSCLRALTAIVSHHDVVTLPDAGERFVRRGRAITAELHSVRIGQQMRIEELRILRINFPVLLLELGELGAVCLAGIPFPQRVARTHSRAHTMELRKTAVGIPCLVPQKNNYRLNREHFLQDALHAVNVTVKGTVR